MNIAEIELRLSELVKEPFSEGEFPFRLAEIYNAPKATITKLRQGTHNGADRAGDVLWKKKLYFRAAEKGASASRLPIAVGPSWVKLRPSAPLGVASDMRR